VPNRRQRHSDRGHQHGQTAVFDETGNRLTTSAIGNHAGWRAGSSHRRLKGDGTMEWAFMDGSGNLSLLSSGQRISTIPHAKE